MEMHHLSGEAGEEVLRESDIWHDIEAAMDDKRNTMGENAMAIISVLSPSEDRTVIVLVDGYMTALTCYLNVLVLDGILEGEFDEAKALMEKLRRHKMLSAQKMLIAHGGLPVGMRKPQHPEWN